jgi:hypothetical protein
MRMMAGRTSCDNSQLDRDSYLEETILLSLVIWKERHLFLIVGIGLAAIGLLVGYTGI